MIYIFKNVEFNYKATDICNNGDPNVPVPSNTLGLVTLHDVFEKAIHKRCNRQYTHYESLVYRLPVRDPADVFTKRGLFSWDFMAPSEHTADINIHPQPVVTMSYILSTSLKRSFTEMMKKCFFLRMVENCCLRICFNHQLQVITYPISSWNGPV